MPDLCPQCGLDRVLVGIRHNCVPKKSGGDKGADAKSVELRESPSEGRGQAGNAKAKRPAPPEPKRGRPRIGEPHVKYEPWLALNMSRATFYRRKAEQREAK